MKRLLLFREDHLGDLILTTPLIKAFAQSGYHVDVLVRKAHAPILYNSPFIQNIFTIESLTTSFPQSWIKVAAWIRTQRYDVLVLPNAKPKEMILVAFFSRVRTRIMMHGGILGRLTGNICLSTHVYTTPRHTMEVWLDIARRLGIETGKPSPEVFLTDVEIQTGKERIIEKFGTTEFVIGLHPGSAGNTCNLPFVEYGKFLDRLLDETELRMIVTGGPGELKLIQEWPDRILNSHRVWVSAGQLDLRQLASVIKHLGVFITPSTGPLHIANADGVETFSPFCSRIGHSDIYWGNTNGRGTVARFKSKYCTAGMINCSFKGVCDADIFFERFMTRKIVQG